MITRPGRPSLRAVLREPGLWTLVLLGVAYFYRPLFLGETFFFRDLYLLYLSQESLFAELLSAGELPWWNPYLHGGMPYLGDVSNSALYPANLLSFVLSSTAALGLGIVLHVVAAAAAAYGLARVLGLAPPAAWIAGAVFGYGGVTLSQANLLIRLQATPYVPLLLLFWHLFLTEGRRRYFVLAALCGALQLIAGAPTIVAPSLVVALLWALALAGTSIGDGGVGRPRRRLLWWGALSAVVTALSAVQLLPALTLVTQSSRGEGLGYEAFAFWSLHPLRLPELFLPGYLGSAETLSNSSYWGMQLVDRGFPYFLSLYLGAIPLVLALLGALARLPEPRLRRFFLVLASVVLLFALGRFLPFFELLYQVPGIRVFRFPVKLLSIGVLPVALLAGFGAQAVLAGDPRNRRRIRWIVGAAWGVLGSFALALLVGVFTPSTRAAVLELLLRQTGAMPGGETAAEGLAAAATRALAFALLATLLAWWASRSGRLGRPALVWGLAAVLTTDLLAAGRDVNPTVPAEMIDAVPAVAGQVRDLLGDGRLYRAPRPEDFRLDMPSEDVAWLYRWNQEMLHFYLGASYRLPVIFHDDFHGLAPLRTAILTEVVKALPWEERWPILDAAAVRVVMTHDAVARDGLTKVATLENASRIPVHVYRNDRAAERLEWIGVWHTATSPEEAFRAMRAPGFDPRQHAVLETASAPRSRADCEGPARIELRGARASRRSYSVEAPCAGVLVFAETFYPEWQVEIDGEKAPTWAANVAFLAAPVSAGTHEVVLRYVPRSFYRGLAISAAALACLLTIWPGRRPGLHP